MVRIPRRLSTSSIYHVMIRGNEKRDIFADDEDKYKFIDVLRLKKAEKKFELYSYCLMSNHVHLLINEKDSSIGDIMKCINVSYAMYFNRKYNRVGHLFQDRFRSEVVENDSYMLSAARYIHNNPVLAGVSDSPGNYKWSSYREYIGSRNNHKVTDVKLLLEILSINPEKAIKEFINWTSLLTEERFLDVEEKENKKIMTKPEALAYLDRIMRERGVSLHTIQNLRGSVKGTIKHELAVMLKDSTNLSYRDIGALLGISKSTVQELE